MSQGWFALALASTVLGAICVAVTRRKPVQP